MTKSFALVIILILTISSLIMVKPAFAQTTPKPSVPEFTFRFVESSLEVTTKNQPLTAYVGTNGSNPSLYYGFRFKDHENIQDWNYAPIYYVGISSYGTYYKGSASDYTVVSFPLGNYPLTGILDSGRIDLQVMALIGNEVPTNYENGSVYGFDGAESNWSTTQTITIPASSNSTSPTPTIPEFPSIAILLLLSMLSVAVVLSLKKQRIPKNML
jgi:hypothetical protein